MYLHVCVGGVTPNADCPRRDEPLKTGLKKASVVWHGSKAAINQPGPEDTHTWKVLVDTRSVSHTH